MQNTNLYNIYTKYEILYIFINIKVSNRGRPRKRPLLSSPPIVFLNSLRPSILQLKAKKKMLRSSGAGIHDKDVTDVITPIDV